MMRIVIIIILDLLLNILDMQSQCNEQQLVNSGNSGPLVGSCEGQQIRACQNGKVTSITLFVYHILNSPTAKIEIYKSATNYENLVWTVDNLTPILGWWTIDMEGGTGVDYNLEENEIFSIRYWNTSDGQFDVYTLGMTIINPYIPGDMLNCYGNVCEGWDKTFIVAFNNNTFPVQFMQPLELYLNGDKIELSWIVSNEINVKEYHIERSANGTNYKKIWETTAHYTANEGQYSYIDYNPQYGMNYYRLITIDFDGTMKTGEVVSIKYNPASVSVYPNPVYDKLIIVSDIKTKCIVYNHLFNSLLNVELEIGLNHIDISELSTGMIVVQTVQGDAFKLYKL